VDPTVGKITFEDAAKDLLNDYKVNGKKTHDHAKRRIEDHLAKAETEDGRKIFGGRRLSHINTADVRAFVAVRQAAGASNGEINRELAALKRMYTLAIQAGKLHARPYIPMLQEANPRSGFFEREQFEAVRGFLPL